MRTFLTGKGVSQDKWSVDIKIKLCGKVVTKGNNHIITKYKKQTSANIDRRPRGGASYRGPRGGIRYRVPREGDNVRVPRGGGKVRVPRV